jgi:hypothetical protein
VETPVTFQPAKPAASAASTALIVLAVCVGAFLPPFNQRVLPSVALVVVLGLAITVSLILHLFFIGLMARQLGRSATLWVVVALVTLPLGSTVGLILFEWALHQEQQRQQDASPPRAA